MIVEAVYRLVQSYGYTVPIYYGSADGADVPYIVMTTVDNGEGRLVLCGENGDYGELLLRFSLVSGSSHIVATDELSGLQIMVREIFGEISDGSGGDYTIVENRTDGVKSVNMGEGIMFKDLFESFLKWGINNG